MGRSDRTKFAVLGVLARGRASGHGLRARFGQARTVYWSEVLGRIYPAFAKLVEERLIERVAWSAQHDDGGRKVYRITQEGSGALASWMARSDVDEPTFRDEVVLRVSFGTHVDPEVTRELLEGELGRVLEELEALDHDDAYPLQDTFERMAREWSVRYLFERVAWCRACLKRLDGWEGSV